MQSQVTIGYMHDTVHCEPCPYSATEQTRYMSPFLYDGEILTVEAIDQEARDAFVHAWLNAGGSYAIIGTRDEY
jgi:hypothetical protein